MFKAYDSEFIKDLAKNDKDVAEALGDNLDEMIASIEAGIQSLGQSGNHKEIEALNDDLETLKDIQQIFHEELKVASAEYQKQRAVGKTDDARISLSAKDDFSEYNKPITEADIQKLRAIGGKSINEFTDKEIEATQKWAYKYFQQMGPKSPFFRRWFGDWRAYDKRKISQVIVPTINISDAVLEYGDYSVQDTGWIVHAGSTLNDDTRHHTGGNRINVKSLNSIESILKNSVLLDTIVSQPDKNKKSKNTAFLHKLYTLIKYDGRNYIAKTTIEEFYDESKNRDPMRAYNLKAIKIEPANGGEETSSTNPSVGNGSEFNISDLYSFVKNYDKDFTAGKLVNKEFVNSDGTPIIFYHGTPNGTFTEFRDWQYFTPNEDYAGNYLNQGAISNRYKKNADNPKVYSVRATKLQLLHTDNKQ